MLRGESTALGSEELPGGSAGKDIIQGEILSTRDATSGSNKSLEVGWCSSSDFVLQYCVGYSEYG